MFFPEEPKMKLTVVSIEDLGLPDVQIIAARVFPSPVWKEGKTLVIRGHRDPYEFQEVRRRICGGFGGIKRLLVVNLESDKLPFLPSEDNRVKSA